jgi:hypothetical protein
MHAYANEYITYIVYNSTSKVSEPPRDVMDERVGLEDGYQEGTQGTCGGPVLCLFLSIETSA